MGHVMVHMCVYPYLKDICSDLHYIGSIGGMEKKYLKDKFDYYEITPVKFSRTDMKSNLSIPFRLHKAIKEARAIIDKTSPSVVFCGGGFVCVPVAIAAKRAGIPVILHESDRSLGLANKISLRYSKLILTTFPDTLSFNRKTVYCGAPLRRELYLSHRSDALKNFGFSGKKPVLLVLGGSKGSKKINSAIVENSDRLLEKYDILHICGNDNTTAIKRSGYVKKEYLTDMAPAYAAADLAVSRCGSNTAFELIAMGIPTLFIPLSKKASRGDQIENAEYFRERGLAAVLNEENLDDLVPRIEKLYGSKNVLKEKMMRSKVDNADKKIADILKNYL